MSDIVLRKYIFKLTESQQHPKLKLKKVHSGKIHFSSVSHSLNVDGLNTYIVDLLKTATNISSSYTVSFWYILYNYMKNHYW